MTNNSEPLTWEDAIQAFLDHKEATLEDNTSNYYKSNLAGLRRWVEAQGISLQDFQGRNMSAYLVMRKSMVGPRGTKISDHTRHHDAVSAKVFFKFCHQEKIIPVDPLRDYQVPGFNRKKIRVPSKDEVSKVLTAIKDIWDPKKCKDAKYTKESRREYYAKRNFAIVAGLITTGCRISEMLNLVRDDYRPDEGFVVFRNTKTGDDREVPISEDWTQFVAEYLELRPESSETNCLFANRNGEDMAARNFSDTFKYAARFAGLEWITLHTLRHYAATQLAQRDLFAAKEILGHHRIQTTMIYAHAQREHVRQIHKEVGLLSGVIEAIETAETEKPIMVNKRPEKNRQRKILI